MIADAAVASSTTCLGKAHSGNDCGYGQCGRCGKLCCEHIGIITAAVGAWRAAALVHSDTGSASEDIEGTRSISRMQMMIRILLGVKYVVEWPS